MGRHYYPCANKEVLEKLYKKHSAKEIGRILGHTREIVLKALKFYGIPIRLGRPIGSVSTSGKCPRPDDETILNLGRDLTNKKAAEELHVSKATFWKWYQVALERQYPDPQLDYELTHSSESESFYVQEQNKNAGLNQILADIPVVKPTRSLLKSIREHSFVAPTRKRFRDFVEDESQPCVCGHLFKWHRLGTEECMSCLICPHPREVV